MVQQLARPHPPGRNDPCPCGSGKKYKRCCLGHAAPAPPERRLQDVLDEARALRPAAAVTLLEEARPTWPDPLLDELLVEFYLTLPPEEAEGGLRAWWEREHDRYSGAALAHLLVEREERGEALSVLLDSYGTHAWAEYWRLLSMLHDEQGDIEAAVAALEQFTRLTPDFGEGWLRLADMQQRLGLNERALGALRRAGDAMPDSVVPRILRLRILTEDGRWREARDLAEALLEGTYPDVTPDILQDLRDMLARAYFVLGDFDAARHLWQTLLVDRPDDADVCLRLAELEMLAARPRRALQAAERHPQAASDLAVLDLRLRSLLALHEYGEAAEVAQQIEGLEPLSQVGALVRAASAIAVKDYSWALEQLEGEPAGRYRDLWHNLRLDCLAHLARWGDILPALKTSPQRDDAVLTRSALICMAAGKLDLAERLLDEVENHQVDEVRALAALLTPLRQIRRAAETRRQQQVDEAEKQRRAAENRDLRRRVRDLERHNAALADALAAIETAHQQLLDLVGVSTDGGIPTDWEEQLRRLQERAHKDALEQELRQAEQRLRGMLSDACWRRLPEGARAALREGEWLFAAVEGEDRDYGAALLEYARGLERAYKDTIFVPVRNRWIQHPGPAGRLQDEGHDPSLAPFVRFVLQGGHLTLGSMAAALDRMGDARRQGVAIGLLRERLRLEGHDERSLEDWRRTAERLLIAAEARNQPAHAAAVSREAVRRFRELVLGTDGLLHALLS